MVDQERYPAADVESLARQIAMAAGVPPEDAAVLADSLVDADLHGISTHGISRLNIYIRRIQRGLIDPRAELRVEQRLPAVLLGRRRQRPGPAASDEDPPAAGAAWPGSTE